MRPKKYRNAAEKQRAYRQRQKAENQQLAEATALLELVKSEIVTLRNCIELYKKRSGDVVISSNHAVNVHRVLVDGYWRRHIEDVVFQYLVMTNQVVLKQKRYGQSIYEFEDD